MRRHPKCVIKGLLLVGGGAIVRDLALQWWTRRNTTEPLSWQNVDISQTLRSGAVAAVTGAAIGEIVHQYVVYQESRLPFDPNVFLNKVLLREHLQADPRYFEAVLTLKTRLQALLARLFQDKLAAAPQLGGSFYKRTAIVSDYDLDFILPFKYVAYPTLKQMYQDVYDKLQNALSNNVLVTKQSRSIGIDFADPTGDIHVDIVPGREIGDHCYYKKLNMYVNGDWFWHQGSSMKADLSQQMGITRSKPMARRVIKLLKLYRILYAASLSNAAIEQCVVHALSKGQYGTSASLTENLLNSMHWLAKKLCQVTLWDIANTNNNLHAKMSDFDRRKTAQRLFKDIAAVEHNPRFLKEVFDID